MNYRVRYRRQDISSVLDTTLKGNKRGSYDYNHDVENVWVENLIVGKGGRWWDHARDTSTTGA